MCMYDMIDKLVIVSIVLNWLDEILCDGFTGMSRIGHWAYNDLNWMLPKSSNLSALNPMELVNWYFYTVTMNLEKKEKEPSEVWWKAGSIRYQWDEERIFTWLAPQDKTQNQEN